MKFIHLTDTHVSTGALHGSDPLARLEGAVASINAEHGDAEFVVVTGDLVDAGDLPSYVAFRERIGALKMPVHLMVGNHDRTPALVEAFPDVPRDDSGAVQCSISTSEGRFILLDTLRPGTDAGTLNAARRNWLRKELEADDQPVFLFMHHPPFPIGIPGLDVIALEEPELFYDVVAPHKSRIRHLFFGHVHRAIWGTWRGIPFSCMRGLNHQVALELGGPEDKVTGSKEPPAYGVVLVGQDQVTVHLHDYTQGAPAAPL
ncbi:MAG: phosphodiesterase [Silicimonas sp.]|nr:phosphodiesterase [Silicimonas sp.]